MTTDLGPICLHCAHLARKAQGRRAALPFHCQAFPAGIPRAIMRNEVDHRQPVAGDAGIVFESVDALGDHYAALVFDAGTVADAGVAGRNETQP